jgi:hypothetical protein
VLELKSDFVKIEGEEVEVTTHSHVEETAPVTPSGFCSPWTEHSITFNEPKLNENGYVASEQFDKSGVKCYYLYKRDGAKRLFTLENLLMLGMANRVEDGKKSVSEPEPEPTTSTEIVVYDDGKLWDEDDEYGYDEDYVKASGYKGVARAERKGLKGYVLIKLSGEQRFMTVDKLKLLRFVIKK